MKCILQRQVVCYTFNTCFPAEDHWAGVGTFCHSTPSIPMCLKSSPSPHINLFQICQELCSTRACLIRYTLIGQVLHSFGGSKVDCNLLGGPRLTLYIRHGLSDFTSTPTILSFFIEHKSSRAKYEKYFPRYRKGKTYCV